MNRPRPPQHGKPTIQALADSIREIIAYLPSLEVRGNQKNVIVQETPYGRTIEVKEQTAPAPQISEEIEAEETPDNIPIYYNNVCRLCTTNALSTSCMHMEGISGANVFAGSYLYNLNGAFGSTPSSMMPVETLLGGTPTLTSDFRTYKIGLQFDLQMTEVPSSDIYSAIKAPYYWDWNVSLTSKLETFDQVLPSGTLSSHFVPVAYVTISSTVPFNQGYYDAVLENVNQSPTLIASINPQFVQLVNNYIPENQQQV